MKTIGLIGGMSWESSLEYYKIFNETVKESLGGLHSAKIILNSLDFDEIEKLQHRDDWEALTKMMVDAAKSLERAGADMVLIGTNTMHLMAPEVQNSINTPLLHIADATGHSILERGLKKVALLGTKFTMEKPFYKKKLTEEYGLEVLIPDEKDREYIHHVIYNELCLGQILETSRERFVVIIEKLIEMGAEGVVLGCTEIPLLIRDGDVSIPVMDTTSIHAKYAVAEALK